MSVHATRAMRRGTPTISCVMPTYARPQLALDAVARFLQQELEDAELIVVDDSPGSLAELLPVDERIIHVRLDRRHTIGAKRNLGCAAARAELFANWDDDDWYAPQRLGVQIAALKDTGADVVGLDRLLYYEPANGQAWRYAWPAHGRPWLHDATLAFTRSFWERNPFPDTNMGIDCGLLWTPQAKHLHALSDECLYVGIIHAHNTSPKLTSDCAWAPIEPEPVLELLAGDPVVAQLLPVS